jgi:hypothetical protein
MEKKLVDYILAQHAEADAFEAEAPGNCMGRLPGVEQTAYWADRVPTGTFAEFDRIELEESAYYSMAEAYSKSYARSFDFSTMTDEKLNARIKDACEQMDADRAWEDRRKAEEDQQMADLAGSLNVDRKTLDRWLDTNPEWFENEAA